MNDRQARTLGYSRLDERHQPKRSAAMTADPADLIGNWINADHETCCLRGVRVDRQSGALSVNLDPAFGNPKQFPSCASVGYLEGSDASAFTAMTAGCTSNGYEVRLEGNLNAGLLVLCCYKTWHEEKGGNCFSREYFAKADDAAAPGGGDTGITTEDPLFHGIDAPKRPAPGAIAGHWRNAERDSQGLNDLVIRACEGGVIVSAAAHGDIDWGDTVGRLYTDVVYGAIGGVAAQARFDFGFAECRMQIRLVGGALIVASYTRFGPEQQREPSFVREFFYRL
jgi:hypothetical protein